MIIIGLTGPSGTGKSTAALTAESLGYVVIDCDKVAAEVIQSKTLLKELEAAFGDISVDGKLDRKALAKKAFSSPEKTELLNSIMLPPIAQNINERIEALQKTGATHFLLDAPTLYESGADKMCTAVIAVLAEEKTRAKRILERDALTPEQLESRLKAAKPDSFYLTRAEHTVYNNENLLDFKSDITKILKKYKEC